MSGLVVILEQVQYDSDALQLGHDLNLALRFLLPLNKSFKLFPKHLDLRKLPVEHQLLVLYFEFFFLQIKSVLLQFLLIVFELLQVFLQFFLLAFGVLFVPLDLLKLLGNRLLHLVQFHLL